MRSFGAKVSDWAGDAVYLRFDGAHHRIVFVPSRTAGILAVEYAVENVNLLMRNYYVLRDRQIAVSCTVRAAARPPSNYS